MVALVGEDLAAGHVPGQREEGGVVRHEATGEDEGGVLAVQRRQFGLELFVEHGIAGYISVETQFN